MSTVAMICPSGTGITVVLPDGSLQRTDASGNLAVPAQYMAPLLAAGWVITAPGTTSGHVP